MQCCYLIFSKYPPAGFSQNKYVQLSRKLQKMALHPHAGGGVVGAQGKADFIWALRTQMGPPQYIIQRCSNVYLLEECLPRGT